MVSIIALLLLIVKKMDVFMTLVSLLLLFLLLLLLGLHLYPALGPWTPAGDFDRRSLITANHGRSLDFPHYGVLTSRLSF